MVVFSLNSLFFLPGAFFCYCGKIDITETLTFGPLKGVRFRGIMYTHSVVQPSSQPSRSTVPPPRKEALCA